MLLFINLMCVDFCDIFKGENICFLFIFNLISELIVRKNWDCILELCEGNMYVW